MRDPGLTPGMRARRAVPVPLARVLIGARSRAKLRDPAFTDLARREMEHLIGAARPDDVERAAAAYVHRFAWRSEMRYHPRLTAHQEVTGLDHLRDARALGRGVVLSFLHHGQYEGALASIGFAGEPMKLLVDPLMLGDDAPTFLRQHVRVARMGGNETVSAAVGSAGTRALLEAGQVVAVAPDVPSRSRLWFLGRERLGSTGGARVAHGCAAPVVVLSASWGRGRPVLRLDEPVDPGGFATAEELAAHVLRLHEPAVLDWPEGYHQPLLRWGVPEPLSG